MFDVKLLLLISVFVYAFFKFAWGVPAVALLRHHDRGDAGGRRRQQGANASATPMPFPRLIGIAADHANRGLRAFYFAIAAMTWIFHPVVFMSRPRRGCW